MFHLLAACDCWISLPTWSITLVVNFCPFNNVELYWNICISRVDPLHLDVSTQIATAQSALISKWELPGYSDIFCHPAFCLKSRHPNWSTDRVSSVEELWRETWETDHTVNAYIIDDPTALVTGFDLRRREWWLLNRFRCDSGWCAVSLYQSGYTDNPLCICGDTQSVTHKRLSSQQVWRWSPSSTHHIPILIDTGCGKFTAYAKERLMVQVSGVNV